MATISPPSRHAIENHGANAYAVTRRLECDEDAWCRTCQDGRRYTFKQLPGGKAWDVSIDDPRTEENITRFTCTSKDWIARKLLWCSLLVALICGALFCGVGIC